MPKKSKKAHFRSGYKDADAAMAAHKASRRSFRPFNFKIPPGGDAKVIFLDDQPTIVQEHSIPRKSRAGRPYNEPVTSPRTFKKPDPLVDRGLSNPQPVAYYTIIDCTKQEGENGKVYQYQKRPIGFKQGPFDTIKRKRASIIKKTKDEGKPRNLKFAVFQVHRSDDQKSATVGTEWEYLGHYSKDKILKMLAKGIKLKGADRGDRKEEPSVEPLDYDEILAPPDAEMMKSLVRLLGDTDADEDEDEDEDDDDLDADLDDDDEDEDERPKKKGKAKSKKKASRDDDDDDDDFASDVEDEDDEEDEDDADEEEDEDESDEEDEDDSDDSDEDDDDDAGDDKAADDDDDADDDEDEEEEDEDEPVKKKGTPKKLGKAKKSKKRK